MNKQRHIVTKIIIGIMSVSPMVVLCAQSLPSPTASVKPLNKVVATVNGEPITAHRFSEFYERAAAHVKAMAKNGQAVPAPSQLRAYLMQQYIDRVLQLQMAKRGGIKVTDKQINQQIQQILKQRHMTLAQFTRSLKEQGFTLDSFKKELKHEMTINMLHREAVGSQVDITASDVAKMEAKLRAQPMYSSSYHVVDVHVPLSDSATKSQKQAALKKAAAFKRALQKNQAVPDGYRDDLGWQGTSDLPSVFMQALKGLKHSGVVGPIDAANGYHVLQVTGVKPAKQTMPTKAQISQMLYMRKLQAASQKWIKKMRAQSDVKVFH